MLEGERREVCDCLKPRKDRNNEKVCPFFTILARGCENIVLTSTVIEIWERQTASGQKTHNNC